MKSFPEVARHLTILKKEDVKLHAVVPRGLVHLRQQELIPGRNLLKARGQGDQPGASRALEDGAQVRRFKLALGRLIQGPTDISFAPKKISLKFPFIIFFNTMPPRKPHTGKKDRRP